MDDWARLYHHWRHKRVRVSTLFFLVCQIDNVYFRPDCKEEFLILDTDKAKDFLKGTRKLRLSGVWANISSPQLVQSTMTQRLSTMVSLRQSRATFPFPLPRPNSPIAYALEQTPVPSRRTTVVMPDEPTRVSPLAKSRPALLTLERVSSESHVHIDAPRVEHSALRCTQQVLYRSCSISCFIVGTHMHLRAQRTHLRVQRTRLRIQRTCLRVQRTRLRVPCTRICVQRMCLRVPCMRSCFVRLSLLKLRKLCSQMSSSRFMHAPSHSTRSSTHA